MDTTIGSDAMDSLGVSDIDPVGSYQRVKNGRWERYTSFNGILDEDDEVGENTIRVPNAYLVPIPVAAITQFEDQSRVELAPTSTDSTVCYRTECEVNAGGLWLEAPGWVGRKLVDDPRWAGIALEVADAFVVKELTIDAAPPQPRASSSQPSLQRLRRGPKWQGAGVTQW